MAVTATGFITDATLLQVVADTLQLASVGELPASWSRIVSDANAAAYLNIKGALQLRGYTVAQIEAWDQGAVYQRALGLFWALTQGGGLNNFDMMSVNKFDRRGDLRDVLISNNGQFIQPGPPPGSSVSQFARMDDSEDRYRYDSRRYGPPGERL